MAAGMRIAEQTLQSALKALTFQRERLVTELDEQILELRSALGIPSGRTRKGAMDALAAAAAAENGTGKKARAAKGGQNPDIPTTSLLEPILGYLSEKRQPASVKEIAEGIKGSVAHADQHNRFSIVVMHALRQGANQKLFKKSRGGNWQSVRGAHLPSE